MRRDLTIKSGNLAGTSDFRVVAPIKKGSVPSLDTVTYKTRVKRVLRTLHAGRSGAFEYELTRVLSDAVERVMRLDVGRGPSRQQEIIEAILQTRLANGPDYGACFVGAVREREAIGGHRQDVRMRVVTTGRLDRPVCRLVAPHGSRTSQVFVKSLPETIHRNRPYQTMPRSECPCVWSNARRDFRYHL